MEIVRKTLARHGFKDSRAKRRIFGPKAAKEVTGARVGRFKCRATHKQMSDLRAAIDRLARKEVPQEDYQAYRENLAARIAHVSNIDKNDAKKLSRYAAKRQVHFKRPKRSATKENKLEAVLSASQNP